MNSSNWENNIAIAGVGLAAAAVAMRLLSCGFRPLLLSRGLPHIKGVEAIPESALRLFDALDLTPALQMAGGFWVEGFENAWQGNESAIRPGRYIHVERSSLAQAAIAMVIQQGATVVSSNTIAPLVVEKESVRVMVGGVEQRFAAAIDATGRSALWSRPIKRHQREMSQIFSTNGNESLLRGRIVQFPGGWAYRLGLPDTMTVGVVSSHHTSYEQVQDLMRESLCLPPMQLHLLGRRPVSPQWAEEPIQDRRLAVGDAALAYSPIAGQGIRFALSSSLAAAAVVRTWRDSPADRDYATQYYRELVSAERLRHLSNIDSLSVNQPPPSINPAQPSFSNASLPSAVYYTGQTKMTGLYINGLIKCTEAIILPDGNLVRWLGNFDLLTMREFCTKPRATASLIEQLIWQQLSQAEALYLIRWCLKRHILSTADL
ncbi:MAG: NAD(P)/FAD-dependent oxidoreductase [Heteroscytonema crispum UTEX LB 1556]